MPTSNSQVKEAGGLNEPHAFLTFRFNTQSELETTIDNGERVAAAWLRLNLVPGIYTSSDTDTQEVLSLAEAYLVLHFIVPALKARKVYGTHFAWESEESDSYAALIDTEWMDLAKQLLGDWITVPVGESHFARPVLKVGPVIDPLDPRFKSEEERLQEDLDRARSLAVALP